MNNPVLPNDKTAGSRPSASQCEGSAREIFSALYAS
jgi:hypothetical protein